ncbi:hypothetical protein LLE49_06995 [Alicyclobacillus tolerans]|uniref:hypothetical protein n=1 Tax=Alicyclobacillus tolerans TaxID=90970 RepID=UPI001F3C67B9|nr:hypothetical protein [Alicyclobacillus tolerans]MCF8564493.1 hypothetical protein [Alicyclobacillus tolerans]
MRSNKRIAARKPRFRLTKDLERKIRSEAAKTGLAPGEYLRLVVSIAQTVRRSMPEGQSIDAAALLQLVKNPLLGSVFEMLSKSALTTLKGFPGLDGQNDNEPKEKATTPAQPITPQNPGFIPEMRQPLPPRQAQQPGQGTPHLNVPSPGNGYPHTLPPYAPYHPYAQRPVPGQNAPAQPVPAPSAARPVYPPQYFM